MKGLRRTLIASGLLGLLAGGVWLGTSRPAATPAPAAASPAVLSRPPASASVVAPVRPTAASPAPVASTPDRTVVPVVPVAEPFVQNYAGQPDVKPLQALPSPTKTHFVRPNVDGCDHNYGEITQCVPWTFPPDTEDKCAWLAARGFKALKVAAEDRQRLDPDGNKVACDN